MGDEGCDDDGWKIVDEYSLKSPPPPVVESKLRGWKVVRLFVSSTFSDFFNEREVLVKMVFPELRYWAENLKLRLVEVDMRWGIPTETPIMDTIRMCMDEVVRCQEANVNAFFLGLLSERYGWVPDAAAVPDDFVRDFGWVHGFSATAMEMVFGALRSQNPNAMFALRHESFLEHVPADHRRFFAEQVPGSAAKLRALKRRVLSRPAAAADSLLEYTVQPDEGRDAGAGQLRFTSDCLDGLSARVLDFFKSRVAAQYPFETAASARVSVEDLCTLETQAHASFLESRSRVVLGREPHLRTCRAYVYDAVDPLVNSQAHTPLLLHGAPGAGKSAIMSRLAAEMMGRRRKKAANREKFKSIYNNARAARQLAGVQGWRWRAAAATRCSTTLWGRPQAAPTWSACCAACGSRCRAARSPARPTTWPSW